MIKLLALKFVHFFITLAQIAFSTCIWLHCLLKDVKSSAFGGQNVTLYSVRLDARYLTKIPDHMALVVGEDAISYNDLVSEVLVTQMSMRSCEHFRQCYVLHGVYT